MGSMRDEMAKVIVDWEKPNQSIQQQQESATMQETANPPSIVQWCLDQIKESPGVTGAALQKRFDEAFPERQTKSRGGISASLKMMLTQGKLERLSHGDTFKYFLAPDNVYQRIQAERRKVAAEKLAARVASKKRAKKKKPFVPHPNSLANLRPKKAASPQAELPLEPRVETPAPAPASKKISVQAAVTLTIKGQEVALTMAEAKELHSALSTVVVV